MKFTSRGSDYLKAALALAIISSVLDVRITLALSFALLLSGLLSQVLLATASEKNIVLQPEAPEAAKITLFKGESSQLQLRVLIPRSHFVVARIASISASEGLEAAVESEGGGSMALKVKSEYAGRFDYLAFAFDLGDPLSLFTKRVEIAVSDFTLDALPQALLQEVRQARPISVMLGERAGKTPGGGQEFFSVDEYRPSHEKRAILWKRVARMPEGRLVIKVRESNIPRTLKIALLLAEARSPSEKVKLIDLACEGAALLGKTALAIGCDVELLYAKEGELLVAHASELQELSVAIIEMATAEAASIEQAHSLLAEADIFVTGSKEIHQQPIALELARRASLVLDEHTEELARLSELWVLFSGREDVGKLVREVTGR